MRHGPFSTSMALWLLLVVALVVFIGLSLQEEIKLGEFTLSKARFPETLFESHKEEIELSEEVLPDSTALKLEEIIEPDTTVHNILIFGDSMTHYLAMSIAEYGTKNNYKITGVTWESSSIPGWSHSGKIKKYIGQVHPDFIIVSLGANELELKNYDRRIPEVEKIVEQFDSIPFIWVGPPLWKEDKGLYSMLSGVLPKGVVFRAGEDVKIARGGDHVHPTRKGAQEWADTLMRWIRHSPHPILAETPDSGTSIKQHKFIYLHPND